MNKSPRPAKSSVRPSALQAESLQHTRREHALETAEDYVEAIADLSTAQGEARVVDLAHRLGVTPVTVNRTLARLQRQNEIIAVLASLNRLRGSPDYELCQVSARNPGVLGELRAERRKLLKTQTSPIKHHSTLILGPPRCMW